MSHDEDSIDRLSPLPRPSRNGSMPEGWVPGHDDETPRAWNWRALKALDNSYRTRNEVKMLAGAIDGLRGGVTALNATISGWQAEGQRRWNVSGKLAWAVGVPLLVIFLSAFGAWAWAQISTLHH